MNILEDYARFRIRNVDNRGHGLKEMYTKTILYGRSREHKMHRSD